VFRRIDKWGTIGAAALNPQSVNAMIKSRCAVAGLDSGQFSAHGLRSGVGAHLETGTDGSTARRSRLDRQASTQLPFGH
jgi:integrase